MKPLSVDIKLFGNPELRYELITMAQQPGVTIDAVCERLSVAGIESNRTSVWRWIRHVRASANPNSERSNVLMVAIWRRVMAMPLPELEALAAHLRVAA